MNFDDIPLTLEAALWVSLGSFLMAIIFLLAAQRIPPIRLGANERPPQHRRYARLVMSAVGSILAIVAPFQDHDSDLVFDTLELARHQAGFYGWGLNLGFFGSLVTLGLAPLMAIYVRRTRKRTLNLTRPPVKRG